MDIKVNVITLGLEQIRPNPWNPNKQSDFIFEKELTSIRDHGFVVPVLVREREGFYEIIDGEHRWRAAAKLGILKIPVNNLGKLPDDIAKKLTIIMNEVKGKPDAEKMAQLIADLNRDIGIDEILRTLPYTETEIDHILANVKIDWDAIQNKPKSETTLSSRSDGIKEVQLQFTAADYSLFIEALEPLGRHYLSESVTDTVLKSVLSDFKRLKESTEK